MNLDEHIRKVPNFSKEGILYYDITSILIQPEVFGQVVEQMLELYKMWSLTRWSAWSRTVLFLPRRLQCGAICLA